MTPITAPPPATAAPDAIAALPGQAPVQQPAAGLRPGGRDGPLRNGNPRGNPNLAPRCGAKVRATGCACRAPAMANGRCRCHGGKSTGPRTAEGRASAARAHTTHGNYAQAGLGAKHWVHTRYCMVMARRSRLAQALTRHLRWLPRALAERVWAYDVPELRSQVHYSQFQDVPVSPGSSAPPGQARWQALVGQALVGQAVCRAGRDARGRFAAPPPPVLRGRKAELAAAHAEAAALAPWKAALKRARMIKRLMMSQDRAARLAKPGRGPLHGVPPGTCPGGRPPGACPGGGTVRPGGVASEGSETQPMNRGAGGGPVGTRAEAPAATVAPKGGAASEGSETQPMNRGAGGGMAAAHPDAPAAALAAKGRVASEGSETQPMNRGAGGGTAAAHAEAPAATLAAKGGTASEGSETQPVNRGAGGGTAAAHAEAPAATVAPKGEAASEGSETQPMNRGAGGGTAAAHADAPAAALAAKGGAASEGSETRPMNRGAGGGTAAADAILAALPNRAARRRWKSLQRRKHPAPRAIG